MATSKPYKSVDAYLKSLKRHTPLQILPYWNEIAVRFTGNAVSRRCIPVTGMVAGEPVSDQFLWVPMGIKSELAPLARPVHGEFLIYQQYQ